MVVDKGYSPLLLFIIYSRTADKRSSRKLNSPTREGCARISPRAVPRVHNPAPTTLIEAGRIGYVGTSSYQERRRVVVGQPKEEREEFGGFLKETG